MSSVNRFQQLMSELGYELDKQEGLKLTYRKNAKFSTLVLVIDLGLKYINPILVPRSIIILERDLIAMHTDFKVLRREADAISEKSKGVLKVLN